MEERKLTDLVDRFKLRQRRLPPIFDHASTWYEPWYFELRLTEEISRAARYGLDLALIYLLVEEPEVALSPERQLLMNDLSNIAASGLRDTDNPGVVLPGHYAICLPHTDETGGKVVLDRLITMLLRFEPVAGLAVFSEGEIDGAELISRALEAALKPPGNVGRISA